MAQERSIEVKVGALILVALGILGLSPYAAASFPLVIPATPGVTKHFCFGIDGSDLQRVLKFDSRLLVVTGRQIGLALFEMFGFSSLGTAASGQRHHR